MPEVFTQSDPPKLIETGEELAQKLQAPLIQLTTHKDLISKGEDDAEEENLIVGTNTPRAKRSSAYYDLLCAQGSHGRSAAAEVWTLPKAPCAGSNRRSAIRTILPPMPCKMLGCTRQQPSLLSRGTP